MKLIIVGMYNFDRHELCLVFLIVFPRYRLRFSQPLV